MCFACTTAFLIQPHELAKLELQPGLLMNRELNKGEQWQYSGGGPDKACTKGPLERGAPALDWVEEPMYGWRFLNTRWKNGGL